MSQKTKKVYRKPRIVSREKLEAVAGTCAGGKTDAGTCASGPINS
jgi:hypothetical protein